jgi:membrane-associated phospholipid phosphatase
MRARRPMPRMSQPEAPERAEPALMAAPVRDAAITAVVVALTACAFAAASDHRTLASIQRLDDAWLRLMISGRVTPLTVIAKAFNVIGHQYVTLPVRIAIAGLLALRRWWWHLAAFATAMVISEALIGLLKGIYSRARPPEPLVATTGASFPSGHAVAASVTAVAAVIALVPAGRRRAWWAAAAVVFSILMGLSRAYLGAHWLSDAAAGILLGTSCALITALAAGQLQRRPGRHPARPEQPARVPVPEHERTKQNQPENRPDPPGP